MFYSKHEILFCNLEQLNNLVIIISYLPRIRLNVGREFAFEMSLIEKDELKSGLG